MIVNSPGKIRTCDKVINSHRLYRWATGDQAGKEGLEPPTNALEVRGSVHLSYLPLLTFIL